MGLVQVWLKARADTHPITFLKGTTHYRLILFFQPPAIKKYVTLAEAVTHFYICRTGRQHNI